MSCRQLFDHAKPNRLALTCAPDVARPCGVAVHGGVGPGRNVEPAYDLFGEYTSQRVVEGDAQGGLLPHLIQDPLGCLSGAQRRCHWSRRSERSHARLASSWSQMVSWKWSTAQSALKSGSSVTTATHCDAFVAAGSYSGTLEAARRNTSILGRADDLYPSVSTISAPCMYCRASPIGS